MWSKQKREIRLIDFGSSGIIRAGKLFAHPCGSLAYLGVRPTPRATSEHSSIALIRRYCFCFFDCTSARVGAGQRLQ